MRDRVGEQLGNYRLTRLLGEGGCAEVYLGEHIHLGTEAAIKVLNSRLAKDDLESFRSEARTIARLEHPNIVRILEFGIEGGVPFLVMSYAPNGNLRQRHAKGVPLQLPTIVSYVKQVSAALQYAHDQKVIHRDVKPENMLLGRHDEVLLSDFGIALIAQSTSSQSKQEVVGTVTYMAPEQIRGKPRPASDQYALGIVVYEWLCGGRPFQGSFTEIATQQMFEPPPPLHEKNPKISPDIEQVVMTALAKEPQQRFATIQAFTTALEQACYHPIVSPSQPLEPTVAAIPPTLYPWPADPFVPVSEPLQPGVMSAASVKRDLYKRGISRRVALAGLAGLAVIGISSGVAWLAHSHSSSGPGAGSTATASAFPNHTTTVAASPSPTSPPQGTTLYTYYGHSAKIKALVWSPNDKRIASASDDYTAQVWDATTGDHAVIYHGHSSYVPGIAWSPDGMRIASSSADTTVQIWNPDTGDPIFTYHGHSLWVNRISWSPNGRYIASGEQSSTGGRTVQVRVWEASTGNTIVIYRRHTNGVFSVAWSPDGTRIASCGYDGTVQVWEGTTGNLISAYSDNVFHYGLAWSPDNTYVVVGSQDALVRVLDANTGNIIYTYGGHTDYVGDVDWSPDGKLIASGSADQTVQVFDAANGSRIYTYQKQSGHIDALAWSRDSKRVASGNNIRTVDIWQAV